MYITCIYFNVEEEFKLWRENKQPENTEISVFTNFFVCVCVCVNACVLVSSFIFVISVCVCVSPFLSSSYFVCLSLCITVYFLLLSLPMHLSVHLTLTLFCAVFLCVCQSFFVSVCLSVCLSLWPVLYISWPGHRCFESNDLPRHADETSKRPIPEVLPVAASKAVIP